MGLKILKNNDGAFRPTWYGRISVKGKKRETNLDVPIEGTIPVDDSGNVKLTAKGDAAFERSRKAAQKAFKAWRKETQKDPAELQRKAHKARTGEDLEGLPLAKLYSDWKNNLIRGKTPSANWEKMVEGWFARFTKFVQGEARKHRHRCETASDVTPELANKWFESVKAAYAWETVLKMKHLISGTFSRLQANGLARINPFANIQLRGGGTGENKKVSRRPLDSSQLERLFEITREDDFVYPLVVTAACTGMRIGDVCRLKWDDVDLKNGLIDIVTAKANVRVWIPILGRLHDILAERDALPADGSQPSPFVFPTAAARYTPHPKVDANGNIEKDKDGKPVMVDGTDYIYKAAQPYFAMAVFGDAPTAEIVEVGKDGKPKPPRDLADALGDAGFTEAKRNRLTEVYARHKAGDRNIDIAEALGVARSLVWMDLREIEKLTGEKFVRPRADARERRATRLDMAAKTRQKRGIGQRAASIYGWHSLRHSFIVLALDAGVPVEKVRQIVGHGEVETTINNYYNPTKAEEAERVRRQMRGTVLDGGADKRRAIGAAMDVPTDGNAVAPAKGKAAAVRALTLARAVLEEDQAAKVDAVILAAGVDAGKSPERALALIAATVDADTNERIAAVIKAAR